MTSLNEIITSLKTIVTEVEILQNLKEKDFNNHYYQNFLDLMSKVEKEIIMIKTSPFRKDHQILELTLLLNQKVTDLKNELMSQKKSLSKQIHDMEILIKSWNAYNKN